MQGLPTGWVGQRRREKWSGESSERKKTESTFIHHLAAHRDREDPEMRSHPPLRGCNLIQRYRDAISLARGTEIQAQLSQISSQEVSLSLRILLCKGDIKTDPCAARPGEASLVVEEISLGFTEDSSRKSLRQTVDPARVTGHRIWDFQV